MSYKITSAFKNEGLAFETNIDGHTIINDATEALGGKDLGASPKKMMLQSLAACSGIDVVLLLNKMRVEFTNFTIDVETTLTEEHPKVFKDIIMVYSIKTSETNHDKVEKAVKLSQEKYCGVSAMLQKNSPVKYSINYL